MRSPSSSFSDVSTIINTIVTLVGIAISIAAWQRSSRTPPIRRIAIATSCVAGLTLILRWFSFFQPIELWTYDWMMQLRPSEGQDPRITVVTISEEDIQHQNPQERIGSLSDRYLNSLLAKLEKPKYKARTIGLDMYRESSTSEEFPQLKNRLRSNRFFTLCKGGDSELKNIGIPVNEEISQGREDFVGFSDVIEDRDGIVRRYLWHMTPEGSKCKARNAFSFLISLHYLQSLPKEELEEKLETGDGVIEMENLVLSKMTKMRSHFGVYQLPKAQGYQMPLNYRSYSSPQDIVESVSIKDVIDDDSEVYAEKFKDKIVLIGVTSPRSSDVWETPYSRGKPRNKKKISGVFLQAHMISQVVSAVLDDRRMINMATWWQDGFLLLTCATLGILSGAYFHWKSMIVIGGLLLPILGYLCYYWLVAGIWVAFVPSAFALIVSMALFPLYKKDKQVS